MIKNKPLTVWVDKDNVVHWCDEEGMKHCCAQWKTNPRQLTGYLQSLGFALV